MYKNIIPHAAGEYFQPATATGEFYAYPSVGEATIIGEDPVEAKTPWFLTKTFLVLAGGGLVAGAVYMDMRRGMLSEHTPLVAGALTSVLLFSIGPSIK